MAASAAQIDRKADAALRKLYAFFFSQKGLMAGLGLQGSKITKINP
jgi:lipid-binding SYLF domain-containing protein